ncbi:MAG TPA: hypothetical protein VF820_02680 [Patescibacteria group bacterium]
MKLLFTTLFSLGGKKKAARKSIKDYQQEILLKQGRDQFKKLLKLGQMPVAFL